MSDKLALKSQTAAALLEVDNLSVAFRGASGHQVVVRDVRFALGPGESVGIVGESGSGKSMTARAIAGLLPPGGYATGSVRLRGVELLGLRDDRRREFLGSDIGMIFQDPLGSLNPVIRVGAQIAEGLRVREGLTRRQARARVLELMETVRIPFPERNYRAYPHEFSGGMRQRAMIAIALSRNPSLVIADEPTTALDVTVATQVLDLLETLCRRHDVALILISHDVRTVRRVTGQTLVMYAGRIVESGPTALVTEDPLHPYTKGLLGSIPPHDRRLDRLATIEGFAPTAVPEREACAFAPRCKFAIDACTEQVPELEVVGASNRRAACFVVQEELDARR